MLHRFGHLACILLGALVLLPAVAGARDATPPWSWTHPAKAQRADAPALQLAPVDQAARLSEDAAAFSAQIAEHGAANKRLRVATSNAVDVVPSHAGRMTALPDGSTLWRLVVHADNATDLRFGFDRFAVPQGVTLHVIDPAEHVFHGPYTLADTNQFGELWLPPIAGSTLILELHAPAGVRIDTGNVHLARVATGYRNSTNHGGPGLFGAGPSGVCNIDVICPLGDLYRDEIRAVAKFYFDVPGQGTYLCTGTLVNNTSGDFTPYFLTANHCISTASEAASMTLFWNYESPTCGQHGGDNQGDNTQNGGATLIAHRADVDFSLVQLNSTPDPSFNVYYAGWDATGDLPDGSIGVHHPSGWVKAITEDSNGLSTMNSCIGSGNQTHWRTGQPYSQGTTEGGSSGSMIMVPSGDITGHDNLIIGTLSGGSAACSGSVPNAGYDCYGKFSVAWDGSSSTTRLKDWLDPGNTGATTLPGADPDGGGGGDPEIEVDPTSLSGTVEQDSSTILTLTISNNGGSPLTWTADEAPTTCSAPADVPWLSLDSTGSTIGAGGSTNVGVTIDATGLAIGSHSANLCIESDDPATPEVVVPVSVDVTLADAIFCSGFEDGEDGSCGAGGGDIVESGPINHAVQNSIDGTSINYITGDVQDADVPNYHANIYNNGTQITFWWNTGAPDIAGVSASASSSEFLVLGSGDTVGPDSVFSTINNPGPPAWAAGADGYLGVRFNCSELPTAPPSGICYGYIHLTTSSPDGFPATIVEYAYDQAGNAITIP